MISFVIWLVGLAVMGCSAYFDNISVSLFGLALVMSSLVFRQDDDT